MWILFCITGILGGVLGGMGMGGGTLLIPLLSIFFGVNQHTAQAINLISFIPMAVIVLIIHAKNKLVDFKNALWIIVSGLVTCVGGCFISQVLNGNVLKKIYGIFLILLAVVQIVINIKKQKKNK